jgi:CheY-like chemotaxis protein
MLTLGMILLAEADAAIAALLIEVLTEEGYSVQTVANGSEAFTALQADRLDLALIDLGLPGMSGWELLEVARAQQIDVPIVIMTASSLAADELEAAGARLPVQALRAGRAAGVCESAYPATVALVGRVATPGILRSRSWPTETQRRPSSSST